MPDFSDRERVHPRVSEGRALQYRDLDPLGKRMARRNWAEIGNVATGGLPQAIASATKAATNPVSTERHRGLEQRRLDNLNTVAGHAVDRPLDLTQAARRQVSLVDAAGRIGRTEGDIRYGEHPGGQALGAGWYTRHASDLHHIAKGTGFDTSRIIDASSAMSPQNDPENEKAAIAALATAHSADHAVTATTLHGASILGVNDVGMSKRFSELSSEQVVAISGTKAQKDVSSQANLYDMSKGGSNLIEGVKVLRGEREGSSVGAGTSKVPTYRASIHAAHNATPAEKSEYHRRIQEGVGQMPYHESPTLFGAEWEANPWGEAHSTQGILNPTAPTPQDTWMQAINLVQPHEDVPFGQKGTGRVGKTLGSDPTIMRMPREGTVETPEGPRRERIFPTPAGTGTVTPAELLHAMGDEATIRAGEMLTRRAEKAGRSVGAGYPSLGVQETAWTAHRVQLDKDMLWTKAQHAIAEVSQPAPEISGQGSMFTPSGGITKAASPPSRSEMIEAHTEAYKSNMRVGRRRSVSQEQRVVAKEGAARNRGFLSDQGL